MSDAERTYASILHENGVLNDRLREYAEENAALRGVLDDVAAAVRDAIRGTKPLSEGREPDATPQEP